MYNLNKIYFYQDKFITTWVKIHLMSETRIVYIYSSDIKDIKNVPVNEYEDFLDCNIFRKTDNEFIKMESDLSESEKEEIDQNFKGDFLLWLKYHKYRFEYRTTQRYMRSDSRPCEFKYTNVSVEQFFDNQLFIPYEEVMDDYPYLNYRGLIMGVNQDSDRMIKIRRDQEIKKLLSLQLI